MDDQTTEFYKLQYTTLRALIAQQYDKQYWWLIYATSANGAIYLWLSEKFNSLSRPELGYLALFASVVITFSAYLLFHINVRTAKNAIKYCTYIERKFVNGDGWGDFIAKSTQKSQIGTKTLASVLFLVQLLISLIILIGLLRP